ncbi:hypothetical protein EIN_172500 [Entamoeba invadens IP1]|uniref:Uncharacterized protein n=1 Tax=Entamoeba invadens IP1 TaxID=370355 RepID=A0A0A1TYI4_ENTIV|nr:hypothetical protein EIN_172500 [Entamoeba invadens IP1]ELP84615.1 hypothetical protein EIN_172500 [Entamoeba invadens IP1]|eukprot:XP_004183961.1 hypothetical protein EIN_172500 [Entamoeba invadens IP1]
MALAPTRIRLYDFLRQTSSSNLPVVLKTLLIPASSYSILTSHPSHCVGVLFLSGLIDVAFPLPKEPSLLPLLSPFLDKMLLTTTVVSLSYMKRLPPRLVTNLITRDTLLSVGSLAHRYFAFPKPIHWDNFFNTATYETFSIEPSPFARVNTSLTSILSLSVLLNWACHPPCLRASVFALPKVIDYLSIFSLFDYFLPPSVKKQHSAGVFSSFFV